jgi:hypothetical protein
MTSLPSPPNRHRRRIVVVVAVVAVGLCWWLWPRGDQRFVGKWELQHAGAVALAGALFELDLRSNGLAVLKPFNHSGSIPLKSEPTVYANWTTDGDKLVIGHAAEASTGRFLRPATQLLRRYLSIDLMTDARLRFIITYVSKDTINLSLPPIGDSFDRYRLVRIPE